MINRAIIIVLDGFGVGELPDANVYGDCGRNTLEGPTDLFAGPFLICGDGGEDLISLTDSQITKYEKIRAL